MLALMGVASIAGSTCIACGSTQSRYMRQLDLLSGLLLVAGLSMIGAMLSVSLSH